MVEAATFSNEHPCRSESVPTSIAHDCRPSHQITIPTPNPISCDIGRPWMAERTRPPVTPGGWPATTSSDAGRMAGTSSDARR